MENSRNISKIPIQNFVPIPKKSLEVGCKSSEILFFRTIIEGKVDELGSDEEEYEEELHVNESLQALEPQFDGLKR